MKKSYVKKIISSTLFFIYFVSFFVTRSVYAEGEIKYIDTNEVSIDIKASKLLNSKSGYGIILVNDDSVSNLCSFIISKKYDAPIFLTKDGNIPDECITEMNSKGVYKVFIIGKQDNEEKNYYSEIYTSIEQKLKVNRMEYETIYYSSEEMLSLKIAQLYEQASLDFFQETGRVLIANKDSKELISAAAYICGIKNMPILLCQKDSVSEEIIQYVHNNNIEEVYILGDENIVSEDVRNNFNNAERISGQNIYDINEKLIERFQKDIGEKRDKELNSFKMYITDSNIQDDVIASTEIAQFKNDIVVLIDNDISDDDVKRIKEKINKAEEVYVIGNMANVSKEVHEKLGLEYRNSENHKDINNKNNEVGDNNNSEGLNKNNEEDNKKYPIPDKVEEITVVSTNEGSWTNIYEEPKSTSKKIGYVYGSLTEIKVLKIEGEFAYVETSNYRTAKRIKGYIYKSLVKTVKPEKTHSVIVDLSDQRVFVYNEKEELVREIVCSTGKDSTPTPTGRFLIGSRGTAFGDVGYTCYNWVRFNKGYLFHSVLFNKKNQIIQSEFKKLGSKASHGCIRMPPEDAKWFYETIKKGTLVVVQE